MCRKFKDTISNIVSWPSKPISKNKLIIRDVLLIWKSSECGIKQWAEENGFAQKITRNTRKCNLLDYLDSKNMNTFGEDTNEYSISDHKGIIASIRKSKGKKSQQHI